MDQEALQRIVQAEQQRLKVHETMVDLTTTCFKQCVTAVDTTRLSGKEQGCLRACAARYVDCTGLVVEQVSQARFIEN